MHCDRTVVFALRGNKEHIQFHPTAPIDAGFAHRNNRLIISICESIKNISVPFHFVMICQELNTKEISVIFCLFSSGVIFWVAGWITGLSKWVVTFTFFLCCGGMGAGSGGGGRAVLAAAARRTSSSCRWICCWIRMSSPSRPCWGTS